MKKYHSRDKSSCPFLRCPNLKIIRSSPTLVLGNRSGIHSMTKGVMSLESEANSTNNVLSKITLKR